MQTVESTMPGKSQRNSKFAVNDMVDETEAAPYIGANDDDNEQIVSLDVSDAIEDDEDDNASSSSEGDVDEGDVDEGVEEPEQDEDDDEDEHALVEDDEEDDEDEDDEGEEDDDDEDEEGEDDEDDEGVPKSKKAAVRIKSTGRKGGKKPEPIAEDEEVQYGIESDEEADDEELQKFEEGTRHQYLLDFHPEAVAVDFEEVRALCTVVRDSNGTIIDPLHRTIPVLTKYEKARILGLRAKQLNSNMKHSMSGLPDFIIDGYTIAEAELKDKRIPFIIRRPLPNGSSEYWRVNDLEVLY